MVTQINEINIAQIMHIAAKTLKINNLKSQQAAAIDSYYYQKKDTIFLAPTGFGKSIVYQIAPLLSAMSISASGWMLLGKPFMQ